MTFEATVDEINIEYGMPTVDVAIPLLNERLRSLKKSGVKAVKIIHGYGSTGKGGKLRKATFSLLDQMKASGLIRDFVIGEQQSKFEVRTLTLIDKMPQLYKGPGSRTLQPWDHDCFPVKNQSHREWPEFIVREPGLWPRKEECAEMGLDAFEDEAGDTGGGPLRRPGSGDDGALRLDGCQKRAKVLSLTGTGVPLYAFGVENVVLHTGYPAVTRSPRPSSRS